MSSVRSAFDSVSGTMINLFIGLIGMIALARLVPVEDHGIYALSYAVYLIFQPFLDFGMTPVYLKLKKVDSNIQSVFFTFNMYVGASIAILILILSPLIASIFTNNILIPLLAIQALSVIFLSMGNQPISQLYREKKFFQAEAIRNLSGVIALIIAIGLAFLGFGLWALVLKFLLTGMIRWLASWWVVKPNYFLASFSELKNHWESIRFGGYITGSRILAGYANNLDKFIVGKLFGESSLGHYEKALIIVDKPNTLRNALTTPAISHIARMHESNYSKSYHLISHLFLFAAGLPALFFCYMVRK